LGENHVQPREAYAEAYKAARGALAIDDHDPEAHVYLGEATRVLSWDLKGEQAELSRALELDHNCVTAHYYMAKLQIYLGNFPEARRHLETTRQLDPLSAVICDL